MWWWEIIKETRQASKEMISLDWDEEMVPDSEQEEEDCKKKLRAVHQYLSSLNGIEFTFGNEVKAFDFTDEYDSGGWLDKRMPFKSSKDRFTRSAVTVEIDVGDIDKLSEDEACAFNEKVKETLGDAISRKDTRGSLNLRPNMEIKYNTKTRYDDDGFIARVSLEDWNNDIFVFFKFLCRPLRYTESKEFTPGVGKINSRLIHESISSSCVDIAKKIRGML
jgi:hypothetical protein